MARDGGAERGSELKAEMMRALEGLEGLVREGRASISRERSRQEEVRGREQAKAVEEDKQGGRESTRARGRERVTFDAVRGEHAGCHCAVV